MGALAVPGSPFSPGGFGAFPAATSLHQESQIKGERRPLFVNGPLCTPGGTEKRF